MNPERFFSNISGIGSTLSEEMLNKITEYIKTDYPDNEDLVKIELQDDLSIKIVGFKHQEIKLRLKKILDNMNKY